MAFIPINTGTGPKILVDTIGTDSAQVIKLGIGASGTSSILAYGQATMTGSIPVVVPAIIPIVPVGAIALYAIGLLIPNLSANSLADISESNL